jgi:NADPH-dependent ferric siderophore reductase
MTDVNSPDELVTRLHGVGRWTLDVVESRLLTPRMRRIRLQAIPAEEFAYRTGQDVMLWLPAEGGQRLYRRYTIRQFDRQTGALDLNIFRHGRSGPGEHWADTVRPGESVEVVGPRGKISLVAAPWQLFVGDETYLPATLAMLEALPAGVPAWALLEVADAQEEQPLGVRAEVRLTWIHRGAAAPGDSARLVAAVESVALPPSPGHAYIGAELQVARAVQRALEARGLTSTQISSKAYWGRGRANAGIGEPKEAEEGR